MREEVGSETNDAVEDFKHCSLLSDNCPETIVGADLMGSKSARGEAIVLEAELAVELSSQLAS